MFGTRIIVQSAAIAVIAMGVEAQEVTVFAAASLKDALEDVSSLYESETGEGVRLSFAGSSALARQIEHGAPADVFISANVGWMDDLQEKDLILADSRQDLLANSLVLIAHGRDHEALDIGPELDLAGLLSGGRLAMALVDAVPAGIYGKAALVSLGQWDGVEDSVAQSDNVRTALKLVATGEAPLGIVYATDASAEDEVTTVGTFPADSHPPIIYPAAAIRGGHDEAATRYLGFLNSEEALETFERHGFSVPGR